MHQQKPNIVHVRLAKGVGDGHRIRAARRGRFGFGHGESAGTSPPRGAAGDPVSFVAPRRRRALRRHRRIIVAAGKNGRWKRCSRSSARLSSAQLSTLPAIAGNKTSGSNRAIGGRADEGLLGTDRSSSSSREFSKCRRSSRSAIMRYGTVTPEACFAMNRRSCSRPIPSCCERRHGTPLQRPSHSVGLHRDA